MTEILPTHTPALFDAAVRRAAGLLRSGEVVAVPTETVYGLAANALDAAAVAKIFEAKGRPAHNPVIVHVASLALARSCTRLWPAVADQLAASFWPGPLTLVVRRAAPIPDIVTAGGDTVGIRWPSHPFMQALIRECGFPIAAPSANPSNLLSPTSAEHVRQGLGGKIALIVDGGAAQVGIESTVLDLTREPPVIHRSGMIHLESLRAVLESVHESSARENEANGIAPTLRSPGQLEKHYAPKARLIMLEWRDPAELFEQIEQLGLRPLGCQVIAHSIVPSDDGLGGVSVIPHDAEAFARALYAELHRCDELKPDAIVVERVPGSPEWRAIADRLKRASS